MVQLLSGKGINLKIRVNEVIKMDDILELVFEGLLNSRRVPKIIKYILIILLCGFVIWIGISVGLSSSMLWGKIFGFALAVVFFIICIFWLRKIQRS